MGSGQVGGGGWRGGRGDGGPDNNVTIGPSPLPRPLGPAGPWRRVKVNNGPSPRGSVVGVGGGVQEGEFGERRWGFSLPESCCNLLLGERLWGEAR